MIASLRGTILLQKEDSLVIEVGGVGFKVFVPKPIASGVQVGETIFLLTIMVVREDSLTLYGFSTDEERRFFELLLGVDGVGPRLALAVLSTLSLDAIRRAVFQESFDVFCRVPGIGKRTAQKVLIHLQGKIERLEESALDSARIVENEGDLLDALTGLGYSVVEAQTAIQSLPKDAPRDLSERIRLALRYFAH